MKYCELKNSRFHFICFMLWSLLLNINLLKLIRFVDGGLYLPEKKILKSIYSPCVSSNLLEATTNFTEEEVTRQTPAPPFSGLFLTATSTLRRSAQILRNFILVLPEKWMCHPPIYKLHPMSSSHSSTTNSKKPPSAFGDRNCKGLFHLSCACRRSDLNGGHVERQEGLVVQASNQWWARRELSLLWWVEGLRQEPVRSNPEPWWGYPNGPRRKSGKHTMMLQMTELDTPPQRSFSRVITSVTDRTAKLVLISMFRQLCFDLIEEWLINNPQASICTPQGVDMFKDTAIFQDYHGMHEFRNVWQTVVIIPFQSACLWNQMIV